MIWVAIGLATVLFVLAFIDIFVQKRHTIRHDYPIVGRLRYLLEKIGPELRQYWVAHDKEEMPFNRDERSWVYATAKGTNNYFGFGTTEQQYIPRYPIIKNAAIPFPEDEHPGQFRSDDIEFSLGSGAFAPLEEVYRYRKDQVPFEGMKNLTQV